MVQRHNAEYFASLVLELMADHGERTATEMCTELQLSIGQMRRALACLLRRGEIHVCGRTAVDQARLYKMGINHTEFIKQRSTTPRHPGDTWVAADAIVQAAMFAMVKVGNSANSGAT
ncbi:hypothetical protein WT83_29040 [Burkholderia territorii]|uniref:Uncharacterized protein n=1 Tax=Burkholderia territorii TaxID=1503055 RepID=A0A125K3V2_9BURK|nr:hypothetical protein WT83_29040 [Burkholderia territorii]